MLLDGVESWPFIALNYHVKINFSPEYQGCIPLTSSDHFEDVDYDASWKTY